MNHKYVNAASYSCPSAVMKKTHFVKTCILQSSLCCYEENSFCKKVASYSCPSDVMKKTHFLYSRKGMEMIKERNVSTWTWASSAIRSAYFMSITFMGAIGSLNCAIQNFRKGSHRTKNFSKIKNTFRSSKTAVSTVIADLQRPKQNN